MEVSIKTLVIGDLVCIGLGGLIEQQFMKGSQEVVKTQIQEQTKTQEVDQKKNNDVIVRKEIINKDGSKEIYTTETHNDVEVDKRQITDDKKTTIVDIKASEVKNWSAALSVGVDLNKSLNDPIYGLSLSRRIVGPVSAGAQVDSKSNVGVFVEVGF